MNALSTLWFVLRQRRSGNRVSLSAYLKGHDRIVLGQFGQKSSKSVVGRSHTLNHGVIQTYLMCHAKRKSIFKGSATMVSRKNIMMEYWSRLMRL